jgi:exodeoxyribonuclease-1
VAEIGRQRQGRPFLHISGMYGGGARLPGLVWPLAPHPTNKNEVIVWDLAHDPPSCSRWTPTAMRLRMFSRSGRPARGRGAAADQDHPHQQVAGGHRQPEDAGPALAERWGSTSTRCAMPKPLAARRQLDGMWDEVFAAPARRQPRPDVDEDLYGGFIGNADRRTLERLRELSRSLDAAGRRTALPGLQRDDERTRWSRTAVPLPRAQLERIDQLSEALPEDDERGPALLGALVEYAEQIAPEQG